MVGTFSLKVKPRMPKHLVSYGLSSAISIGKLGARFFFYFETDSVPPYFLKVCFIVRPFFYLIMYTPKLLQS
jgi:hypothetical protein